MLKVVEITQKKDWEDFLLSCESGSFLQSWNSGVQYSLLGNKIFRLGVFCDDKLIGVCFLIKILARRGNHLYAPYGPVFKSWQDDYLRVLTDYLVVLGKKEQVNFIKISPYEEKSEFKEQQLLNLNYKRAQIHILSESSWRLNLLNSEEQLLSGMNKTHRNLIRRAEKEGVTITMSENLLDYDTFYNIYKETGKRHKFVLYPYNFIKKQLEAFLPDKQALIFEAHYNNEVIASAIIMFYGFEGAYHHGASLDKYNKIPASYLLQWQAILEAKKRGKKFYNFWGIYTGDNKNHPFSGITTFKKGFGGELREVIPAFDLPLNWKYIFNFLVEKIRKIKRGF